MPLFVAVVSPALRAKGSDPDLRGKTLRYIYCGAACRYATKRNVAFALLFVMVYGCIALAVVGQYHGPKRVGGAVHQ